MTPKETAAAPKTTASPATPTKTTATTAPAETPPWWPMVEANQGLISIVALMLALIAFLLENHRANSATKERREEFRTALILVCDDMEVSLVKGDWPSATRMAPRVVNALLNAPPPAPGLISLAVDFVIQVENQQVSGLLAIQVDGFKERKAAFLNDWREKFRQA